MENTYNLILAPPLSVNSGSVFKLAASTQSSLPKFAILAFILKDGGPFKTLFRGTPAIQNEGRTIFLFDEIWLSTPGSYDFEITFTDIENAQCFLLAEYGNGSLQVKESAPVSFHTHSESMTVQFRYKL